MKLWPPVNFELMSHPLNWVTVLVMLTMGTFAVTLCTQHLLKPPDNS